MKVKTLSMVAFFLLALIACKEDDATGIKPSKQIEINLPSVIESKDFSKSIRIYHTDRYRDVDWENVEMYLGACVPDNKLGDTKYDGEYLSFVLPNSISTEN